jgi:hypothetical protein
MTGPMPREEAVDVLHNLANHVHHGCPVPEAIYLNGNMVQVSITEDGLTDWLIALELPLPTWDLPGPWSHYQVAQWDESAFDALPFTIDSVRRIVCPDLDDHASCENADCSRVVCPAGPCEGYGTVVLGCGHDGRILCDEHVLDCRECVLDARDEWVDLR